VELLNVLGELLGHLVVKFSCEFFIANQADWVGVDVEIIIF